MGVVKFYKFINERFSRAVHKNSPTNIDSLTIDLNGTIHNQTNKYYKLDIKYNKEKTLALRKKELEKVPLEQQYQAIYLMVVDEIENIIASNAPTKLIVVAIDGTAPLAKINQQRFRRYRTAQENQFPIFASNLISPGTEFMYGLDQTIKSWVEQYVLKIRTNPKTRDLTVVYLNDLNPGEAEHKIFDIYRSGYVENVNNHIIYGLDADLIINAMALPIDNIFIAFKGQYINVGLIRQWLVVNYQKESIIDDFIVILNLFGNDFIPQNPAISEAILSFEFIMGIYKQTDISLTNPDKTINWDNFLVFIEALSQNEANLIEEKAKKRYVHASPMYDKSFVAGKFNPDLFRQLWYENVFKYHYFETEKVPDAVKDIYYQMQVPTPQMISDMVSNYLSMFGWVYNYYCKGFTQINYERYYKYNYAPLLTDVVNYLRQNSNDTIMPYDFNPAAINFNTLQQLIAITPPSEPFVRALPKEVIPHTKDSSPYVFLFPRHVIIERFGIEVINENGDVQRQLALDHDSYLGVTIMPEFDPVNIINLSNTIVCLPETVQRLQNNTGYLYGTLIKYPITTDMFNRMLTKAGTYRQTLLTPSEDQQRIVEKMQDTQSKLVQDFKTNLNMLTNYKRVYIYGDKEWRGNERLIIDAIKQIMGQIPILIVKIQTKGGVQEMFKLTPPIQRELSARQIALHNHPLNFKPGSDIKTAYNLVKQGIIQTYEYIDAIVFFYDDASKVSDRDKILNTYYQKGTPYYVINSQGQMIKARNLTGTINLG